MKSILIKKKQSPKTLRNVALKRGDLVQLTGAKYLSYVVMVLENSRAGLNIFKAVMIHPGTESTLEAGHVYDEYSKESFKMFTDELTLSN